MTSRNITFDPDAGVPVGSNFTIHTGSDFKAKFNVVNTSSTSFNFTGYTGSSQMTKSVSIGSSAYPAATFNVGFTSAIGGKFEISLGSTATRSLAEGRYVYNILVSSGTTVYNIANGNILVLPGISSAPS
jgi:hypothetical protein